MLEPAIEENESDPLEPPFEEGEAQAVEVLPVGGAQQYGDGVNFETGKEPAVQNQIIFRAETRSSAILLSHDAEVRSEN